MVAGVGNGKPVKMDEQIEDLEVFIKQAAGARQVKIVRRELMSGGAIQENWLVDIQVSGGKYDGLLEAVIRKDAPSNLEYSRSRQQEFELLKIAFATGVTVPEPLWFFENNGAGGKTEGGSFVIMRRVKGVAAGFRLVKDETVQTKSRDLTRSLGRELAKIHSIDLENPALAFLEGSDESPAALAIGRYQAYLDSYHTPRPVLYWAIVWLKEFQPETAEIVLCHNDFRTGNYMVENGSVTGVLDWEFTNWGDRHCDIGWFCAPCWRFGAVGREAGGIGSREDFYKGYEQEFGKPIDRSIIRYWEVMATLRWAVIALQQGERHTSGNEISLELALTAHIVPELEMDILRLTGGVS